MSLGCPTSAELERHTKNIVPVNPPVPRAVRFDPVTDPYFGTQQDNDYSYDNLKPTPTNPDDLYVSPKYDYLKQ